MVVEDPPRKTKLRSIFAIETGNWVDRYKYPSLALVIPSSFCEYPIHLLPFLFLDLLSSSSTNTLPLPDSLQTIKMVSFKSLFLVSSMSRHGT